MTEEITVLEGVILGVVQGATEFLPISSSGHLALANHALGGLPDPRDSTAYFVILHLATLLAVIWFLRREIFSLFGSNARTIPALGVGTVPAALLYLVAGDLLETAPHRMAVVGGGFLVTAGVLWLSDRDWGERKEFHRITLGDAILVGAAQALALLPGVSRSGLTISAGRMCGATRIGAGTFSFLLSIPAILGAVVVQLPALGDLPLAADPQVIIAGFLAAFATGLASLTLLFWVIRSGRLAWFAPYCLLLGAAALIHTVF